MCRRPIGVGDVWPPLKDVEGAPTSAVQALRAPRSDKLIDVHQVDSSGLPSGS